MNSAGFGIRGIQRGDEHRFKEMLKRKKYEWFASRSSEDVLNSKTIISKYLKSSVVDYDNEYNKSGEITSVVSI